MKIQQLLVLALLAAPYTMALDFGANIRGGLAENTKSVNSESIGVDHDVQQRGLGSYSSGKGKVSFGIMIVLSMSATSSLIGSLVYIPLISF
jgi:hypothetical protein